MIIANGKEPAVYFKDENKPEESQTCCHTKQVGSNGGKFVWIPRNLLITNVFSSWEGFRSKPLNKKINN